MNTTLPTREAPQATAMERRETIDSNLLLLWGGVFKSFQKEEYIFREGQQPHFYHQVHEGRVKMVNCTDEGKEFIQGFFEEGQSFGEPPLFTNNDYPASAVASSSCVILRLHISSFEKLLKENFDVHYKISSLLAKHLFQKSNLLRQLSIQNPEPRILSILDSYKVEHLNKLGGNCKVKIEFTRQQIADMTGLRVETVIRVMRDLFAKKILTIEKGKVFY